jgi:selenocysteine-specific elongation factor
VHVIATAGHVDHGKSTLVRALTGMEPDRWAEERRRGMTIDLGYAWTHLDGEFLAFVDVPGHQRFIGNMLAGLGPAPAVMFVVAADEGWRAQSEDHLTAVNALGLAQGVLVITRSDLADPAAARAEALARIARSSLGAVGAVTVSGRTGEGLDELRMALRGVVGRLPIPTTTGRVRLWIDRSFTVRGSGTVVTGTLGSGSVEVGQELELNGHRFVIRGLQQAGEPVSGAAAVSRVAVNLRALAHHDVGRGDVLLSPGAWWHTDLIDARCRGAVRPGELMLHFGTAAVAAQVRPLGNGFARLRLARALPLAIGDRAILRDPGPQSILGGVEVLDVDPPTLRRRGAARGRAAQLTTGVDAASLIERYGAFRTPDLMAMGVDPTVEGVRRHGDWLVSAAAWASWKQVLGDAVDRHAADNVMNPAMPFGAARQVIGNPSAEVWSALVADLGLRSAAGRIARPGVQPELGAAQSGLAELMSRLAQSPFRAPEHDDLTALGLGSRELKVAESSGRLLRVGAGIYLLPTAPALAMRVLSQLDSLFTMSQARLALDTTRRVAVPLLELLDARGWTERMDAGCRRVKG